MPTAAVNGINLYYEVQGQGAPVLFLHGLGSSAQDWSPQFDALKAQYQCIAYDARGHGRSDKPPGPYTARQHAADAAALLDHLGIRSAVVVGLSMGGIIAYQLAVDAPQCILGMVIINSLPTVVPSTFKERMAIWQRLVLFRVMSMRRIGEVIGKRLFPEAEHAALRESFVERWAENDKRAYMDATRGLMGWNVIDRLPEIKIPTLILAADQDYTPVAYKHEFARRMPDAEVLVIENARHAMNFTHPDQVNAALETFFEKVVRRIERAAV